MRGGYCSAGYRAFIPGTLFVWILSDYISTAIYVFSKCQCIRVGGVCLLILVYPG